MPRGYSDDQSRQAQNAAPAREEKGSGAGMAILLVIVGLLFVVGPFILGSYVKIPLLSQIIISAFGVFMLVGGGIMFTITQLYEKATMNEAFVRTGVGGPKVVVNGAAICIPAIHRVTRVSLETIRLEIARLAEESFITGDSLHVDVRAQFYIRVNGTDESIMAAATSLGGKSGVDQMIMDLVGDKLISGLRTVAGRRELDYLHAHVDDYSQEVKKIVEEDLAHNGLFLESVTVTYLNQTPLSKLNADENIFDAQGKKKIKKVVAEQQMEIAVIEAEKARKVTEQEVARDQYVANQEVIRATATAEADLKTKTVQAENNRKAVEVAAQQDQLGKLAQVASTQAVEIAGVEKQKAVALANAHQEQEVKTAQAAKDQAVETATVQKQQAVETATVAKEKAVQTASVEKQQTIEVAKRNQEIAVAEAEKRRAEAEAARIAAETERTKAAQAQLTVEKTAEAERDKNVAVIAKESTAQQTKIERNMEADVTAYTTVKQATAAKEAADANADALRTTAQGKKDALALEAEGDQAKAMVPVNVARQQVTVHQAEVDVEKIRLENQERFGKAGIELQVRLAQIEKDKAVGIAAVEALGRAISSADMKIIGDATMMQSIMASFYRGQTAGALAEGFLEAAPKEVKEIAFETIERVSGAVSSLAKTMFGKDVPADLVATMVKTELAKQTSAANGVATQ